MNKLNKENLGLDFYTEEELKDIKLTAENISGLIKGDQVDLSTMHFSKDLIKLLSFSVKLGLQKEMLTVKTLLERLHKESADG